MHRSRTFVAATCAMLICCALAWAAPQTSDQDSADVTLDIEKYCTLDIVDDLLSMVVTSDKFEGTTQYKVWAASNVLVGVNFNAALRAPTSVTLTKVGSTHTYEVDADVTLDYHCQPGQIGDYWFLMLDPGYYDGSDSSAGEIRLCVQIKRDWDVNEDPAGVYTGTITLVLSDQPPPF